MVLIDIQAAINANTLEGNIYLFDNLRTDGSEGEGTGNLVSAINGAYWADGTQADEQVLNWMPIGIGSLPPTLPKSFYFEKTKISGINALTQKLKIAVEKQQPIDIKEILPNIAFTGKFKDSRGNVRDTGIKMMNVMGQPFTGEKDEAPSELSYLTPQINNITGEAVDKGVIFPAQYGSPIPLNDGWYWSATADTNKTGIFAYTMHITLYKLSYFQGEPVWEPIDMTYESHIKVTSVPKNNAFTNGAMGYLPIL